MNLRRWLVGVLLAAVFGTVSATPALIDIEPSSDGAGTTFALVSPTVCHVGDLAMAFGSWSDQTITEPAEWTVILETSAAIGILGTVYYRWWTDTEAASYNFTLSVGGASASYAVCIDGAARNTPECTQATGADTAPNAPAETASWGSGTNQRFIWATAYDLDAAPGAISAYPTSYDDNQTQQAAPGDTRQIGIASRSLAADNDNPGVATIPATQPWYGITCVVRPGIARWHMRRLGL